jgi:tRNA A-37 threonylcarbamoyl transferase component Bud32
MSSTPEKIDKYVVLGELGRGAMGTVYKARDPVLDRLVAIKMMSEELLIEEEMRGRFNREAKSAAGLQHPNIVTIFDFGELEKEGVPYIVMELLDGVSLAEMMEQSKPERLEDKIKIVTQICRGLDYAHKRGVIHRDVKPGNIQVLPAGTAKVLDFGIAMGEGSTIKTKTGLVMGTPNYMAPEQISGENVDHRADMWAIGVILYELISAERPFVATTVPSLVYRIVHATPAPLDALKLGLPAKLVSVVERVLSKDPDKRFRDLALMARALEQVMGAPNPTKEISGEARARSYTTNFQLAESLLEGGQPQRALEAARRAQALEPSHGSVVDLVHEIEIALKRMQSEPTVVKPGASAPFDAARWVDEARMALTAGNRSEALRIVDDVLAVDPGFEAAVELRGLLDTPARPSRAVSGSLRRTYGQARIRPELTFVETITFGEPPGIQVMTVGPHPQLVAVGGVDGSIRLWDIESRRKLANFRTELHQRAGHEALVTSLAFSPDGAFLASGHVDGNIHLWSLDTGEEISVRVRHEASIGELAFSPDGEVLASCGLDNTVKLWDLESLRRGAAERRLIRQPAGVTSLLFTTDGAQLITGLTNRVLRVHDARTGRLSTTLRGHGAAVTTCINSPDGNQIATGARDCVIRIFDLNRREEVIALQGHKKAIASLSYFPDGKEIASVAMDNSLIIWDLITGTPRTTLFGGASESFTGVVVTGEEPLIVAALGDGSLRIWSPQ